MSCENCEVNKENMPESVPYLVYESDMARGERHAKRWMIAAIIFAIMLFVTNIGWIIYESQFETISYTQDGQGINNVNVGQQGDIVNGTESGLPSQEESIESQGDKDSQG